MSDQVIDNPEQRRFQLALDGDDVAVVDYRFDSENRLVLVHTGVPDGYAGKGVGGRLAQGVFDLLRASGRKAVVKCPFLVAWYARHPEYADVVLD